MTAIELTRDQCVALANFLRRTVDRGMDSGYDEIELLVLAQRALRNASKALGDGLPFQSGAVLPRKTGAAMRHPLRYAARYV